MTTAGEVRRTTFTTPSEREIVGEVTGPRRSTRWSSANRTGEPS
jgi:hypothetical protein